MTIEKYSVGNDSLSAMGLSITGQVRSANEDSCGYEKTQNGELFVVCDGMGGHVGGATASRIGVESIINYMTKNSSRDKRKLIGEALKFANMQILGTASADPSLKGMGTTACVVLVENGNVWIGHVGDSRIYLYSKNEKRLYRVTKDHSLVQSLVDKGELDDREAENHPQKNIILKALGTKMEVEPDVEHTPMKLSKGDIIMICSDGLSGMIDDIHIENVLKDKDDLEDKLQKLVGDANAPGLGKDNITCQLIEIEESNISRNLHPDYNPKWRTPLINPKPNTNWGLWIGCSIGGFLLLLIVFALLYIYLPTRSVLDDEKMKAEVGSTYYINYLIKKSFWEEIYWKADAGYVSFSEDSSSIVPKKAGKVVLYVTGKCKRLLVPVETKDSIVIRITNKAEEESGIPNAEDGGTDLADRTNDASSDNQQQPQSQQQQKPQQQPQSQQQQKPQQQPQSQQQQKPQQQPQSQQQQKPQQQPQSQQQQKPQQQQSQQQPQPQSQDGDSEAQTN